MGHHLDTSTVKRPQFHYKSSAPVITVDPTNGDIDARPCTLVSNTRETVMWCDGCSAEGGYTQLKRVIHKPFMAQVWHQDLNIATGEVISDPRHLKDALKRGEERQAEVTGYTPNYELTGPATPISDVGLDATHDRAVKEGRKESRGRFVL